MSKLKIILSLAAILSAISCAPKVSKNIGSSDNDWQTLFNGKDLDGWIVKIHHHDVGDNYANT